MNGRAMAVWVLVLGFLASAAARADVSRQVDEFRLWSADPNLPDVAPASDPGYRSACGGCHFAYPPGLLPAQSWERLLAGLADHFGENAELPGGELAAVRGYLLNNAGGRVPHRVPAKLLRSLHGAGTPLRISEIPYFVREHDELPPAAVQDNPQVRSFSHCDACHTRADEGSFAEGEIRVPGFAGPFD